MASVRPSLQVQTKQVQTLSQNLIQTYQLISMTPEQLREEIGKALETNPAFEDTHVSEFADESAAEKHSEAMENSPDESETLQDHLTNELHLVQGLDNRTIELGELLISNLNAQGFNTIAPIGLIDDDSLTTSQWLSEIERVSTIIQKLDPAGCCTYDWKESLKVQAAEQIPDSAELSAACSIIDSDLELVKSGKIAEASEKYNLTPERAEFVFNTIKKLNPFPGNGYASGETKIIIPDLSIRKNDECNLVVTVNDSYLPELSISREFLDAAESGKASKQEQSYYSSNLRDAKELIWQVNERKRTLAELGSVLADIQRDFFLSGPAFLKPLTMKSVAERIGRHESTVSRIANDKFIETDFGIIPIRMLFPSAVKTESGEDVSNSAVKNRIREIIESNSSGKPLSDQKIADILNSEGIKIARKTVNKYRLALGLDSSYKR